MRVSVVGDKKIGVCFARFLKKKGFDLVSYFCDEAEMCVKYAVASGCKAYVDLKRVSDESEFIVLAVSPGAVKRVMRRLAVYQPKDKIFCAIGLDVTSDLLNIGSDNTYFSAFVPSYATVDETYADIFDKTVFFEGFGKDYWDLYDVLHINKVKFSFIDKKQKCAFAIASALVTDLSKTLYEAAADVLKKAELDSGWLGEIAAISAKGSYEDNGEFYSDIGSAIREFSAYDSDAAHKLSSLTRFIEIMKISYFN